jgi:2-polyprenyl-3-methyl-5-hydroxy-6-metoxy-1,4-benzoquinol methylase
MTDQDVFSTINLSLPRTTHSVIKNILTKELSLNQDLRILDVGCADGMVYKLAGKCNAVGIECDSSLAEKASKVYEKVLVLDLDSGLITLPDESFDIIVAADVVEHCKNHKQVMKELFRLLKSNGMLVISLPNIAQFFFRFMLLFGRFDYSSCGVLYEGHLRFYTLKTMKKLVKEAGFDIAKAYGSGVLYSYFPFWKTFICPQLVIVASKR